jgi:hypothetical protein
LLLSSDADKDEVATRRSSYIQDFRENGDDDDNLTPSEIGQIKNRQLTVAGVTANSTWAQSFVSATLYEVVLRKIPRFFRMQTIQSYFVLSHLTSHNKEEE